MASYCPLKIVIKLGRSSKLNLNWSYYLRRELGTSSVVDEKTHQPKLSILGHIVGTAVNLQKEGHKVIIVSSGAVGVGLKRMDYEKRPKHISKVQALAAIGQCRLMSLWDQLFGHFGQPIAQILLTRNDIANRTQYLNAQNTFRELFGMGVIPIVNENDTVADNEIKFGDNDTLSAITAAMVHANYLFLMTDVDCLYDKNPRTCPDARAIEVVEDISELQADVSSAGSSLGTGGMNTKIVAARLATSAGVTTVIARSSNPENIWDILEYAQNLISYTSKLPETSITLSTKSFVAPKRRSNLAQDSSKFQLKGKPPLHTRFIPWIYPIRDRHFWLLNGLSPRGTLYIDTGAYRAIKNKAGLFAAGVIDVEGNFANMEAVRIVVIKRPTENKSPEGLKSMKSQGIEVGRAMVNYSGAEIARIKGFGSTEIQNILGYADSEYVARRENISLLKRSSRPTTPDSDSKTK